MSAKSKRPIRAEAMIPWRKRFYWRPKTRWLKRQRAALASMPRPDAAGLIVARDGMPIPLTLKPMEAEPVDDLPRGKGWLYEPKYDGFRCIAFRDSDKVDLQSKKQKSLNRFFPEVAAGLAGLKAERFVPDGVGR